MRKLLLVFLAAIVMATLWLSRPADRAGLVLYSGVDYGPQVAAAFTRKTGIPVTVIELSTGTLLARISAEASRPAWSIAWFDGAIAAKELDLSGLVARHVLPSVSWTKDGQEMLPTDGAYVPTGFTLAGVLIEPKPAKPVHQILSWQSLVDPAWHERIGMNNPAISGPTFPLVAGLLQIHGGWPSGQDFLLSAKRNGLKVFTTNKNTLAGLRNGAIGLAMVQSSAAYYVAHHSHRPYVIRVPKPAFPLVRVLIKSPGLSRKKSDEVQQFLRFALSKEGQSVAMNQNSSDSLYWPVVQDAPPRNPILPPVESLQLLPLDPAYWGPMESKINQWFSHEVIGL